jgi:hypothetical protein
MHIDRPAIIVPERLVLRPPRFRLTISKEVSGWLSWRQSLCRQRTAGAPHQLDRQFQRRHRPTWLHGRQSEGSGKVESGVLTGAGLHGSLGLERGTCLRTKASADHH